MNTPSHVIMGDNPSFCRDDNQTLNQILYTDANDRNPQYQHINTSKYVSKPKSHKQHTPLQHIFTSSMKRINKELESIKKINKNKNHTKSKSMSKVNYEGLRKKNRNPVNPNFHY